MEIQGKLLRVLEVFEYKPVGGSHLKKTNVRVIAATNRDLKTMVRRGHLSRRSLLSPECLFDLHSAVAGAQGRHSAAGVSLSEAFLQKDRVKNWTVSRTMPC
jgi:sigma54-dependent transcription regulator